MIKNEELKHDFVAVVRDIYPVNGNTVTIPVYLEGDHDNPVGYAEIKIENGAVHIAGHFNDSFDGRNAKTYLELSIIDSVHLFLSLSKSLTHISLPKVEMIDGKE